MKEGPNHTNNKILWLSIVQGWAILLVVIGHVNGFTYNANENEMYPLSAIIHTLVYSFHMPLFMFVSGGLLWCTRLERNWSIPRLYADKLKRLMIPYIFFSTFTLLLKSFLSSFTKRGAEISLDGLTQALVDPVNGPLNEMWFVGTLMWLMFMYPVYKAALRWQWTELLLLIMTLLPFVFSLNMSIKGWLNISAVPRYAFFFVGGLLFFKYRLYRFFEKRIWPAISLTLLFIASVVIVKDGVTLLSPCLGILMSIAWGVWIADRLPNLFGTFRDYSFQVFLLGIFPQMFIELFLWKRFHNNWLQVPYYAVSCIAALLFAVLVGKLVSKIKTPWIRWCFGLK